MNDIENLPLATDVLDRLPTAQLAFRSSHSISAGGASEIATTGDVGPAESFEPGAIRYIKLGENGKWASQALEQGIIPFGYRCGRPPQLPGRQLGRGAAPAHWDGTNGARREPRRCAR